MLRYIVHIDFPALDSLVAYLNSKQQAEIDAATSAVQAVTAQLKQSSNKLAQAIQTEQNT